MASALHAQLSSALTASMGCQSGGATCSKSSLPAFSLAPLQHSRVDNQSSFLGGRLLPKSIKRAQAGHQKARVIQQAVRVRSAATAERVFSQNTDNGAVFRFSAPNSRSRSSQLPSYCEFVEPGSTLGLPSRATWTPVKLPGSFAELTQAVGSPKFLEAVSSPQAAMHSAYFAARTVYFLGQSGVATRLLGYVTNGVGAKVAQDIHWTEALNLVLGSITELHRMDQENVRRGFYRAPYDMAIQHRQWSPAEWMDKHEKYLNGSTGSRDLRTKEERKQPDASALAHEYPEYYLQHFHWQTGGWLEDRSAQIYEYTAETLFSGAQDMMQRQTLVPLHFYMRGKDPSSVSILDLACGTGRFLTFIKDNYPTARTYGVDLSPNYLKLAEENMDYFQSFDSRVNGHRGLSRPRYIHASAEQIPLPDNSLDVVTCVYLFHELPPAARRNVIKEAARVLKPGGIFVWTDSFQKGDVSEMDAFGRLFPVAYHEPYYLSFRSTDFKKLFAAEGLSHESTVLAHLSKVMCFRKGATSTA